MVVSDTMPLDELLIRAGAALLRARNDELGRHGLTATAVGLLAELDGAGGASHRDASGRLGIAPATLTPVVDALERASAVRRVRDADDRRVVRLMITAAGRDLLRAARADQATGLTSRLPVLSPVQERAVRAYLRGVLDAAVDG